MACSTYECVYICFVLFVFYSDHVCEQELCWGTPLYCEQFVFKYTAVGFMEALKPFVGLFHNGSILSFALVQGIDPESFVCNWIPMQVLGCNHLVPHHCWVEGQPGRDNWRAFKPLNVSAQPWDWVKGDNGDMTNPYRTITTVSWSWN